MKRKTARKTELWKKRLASLNFRIGNCRKVLKGSHDPLDAVMMILMNKERIKMDDDTRTGIKTILYSLQEALIQADMCLTMGEPDEVERKDTGGTEVHGDVRGTPGDQQDGVSPQLDVQQA